MYSVSVAFCWSGSKLTLWRPNTVTARTEKAKFANAERVIQFLKAQATKIKIKFSESGKELEEHDLLAGPVQVSARPGGLRFPPRRSRTSALLRLNASLLRQ